MNSGIYIHIPFCRNKCDYCSFFSIPVKNNKDIVNSYIDSLLKEIGLISDVYPELEADTIYLGGGTPSILDPCHIEKILNRISGRFKLTPSPEITIEMNPDDLGKDKLEGFLHAGINRIVLGVQSLNNNLLNVIGRKGKTLNVQDLDLFFSHGKFVRCVDIIAGLPGQEKSGLLYDLDTLCGYRPEHISLYLLSVDKSTPLGRRFTPDDTFEKNQADLWGPAMDFLDQKGYIHYEISNYCLPGYESRHNSKYWDFSPYIGFGPGSHSFIDNARYSNHMDVLDYINADKFIYNEEPVSINNVIVEFIMTSLRRINGFTGEEFMSVTGLPLPDHVIDRIYSLISEGMMHADYGRYFLSKKGLFFADRVIYSIVENYL